VVSFVIIGIRPPLPIIVRVLGEPPSIADGNITKLESNSIL